MIEIFNPDDTLLARISPDDDSYRRRAIMEVDQLVLMFSAPVHIEIPVGAYCEFQGSRYTLMRPEQLTMHHTRDFEYTATFEGESAYAKIWKFRCLYNGENRDMPTDGRLKFSLTATAREHLQMFVDNMNARTPEADWTIGNCIESTEKVIGYDHAFCLDALSQMAEAFETEWSIEGRAVSLCKTSISEQPLTAKDERGNPVPLSYGRGRGFKPNVGRSNYSDVPPIETLFVQGGDRNIDRSRYGSSMLHLPLSGELSFDGEHFEGEGGFDNAKARLYKADALGFCISRADKPKGNGAEESLDLGDVYPSREGTVSDVIAVNTEANIYDFTDESIPDKLDYSQYRIAGEKTTVLFQSGELAGKEFDLEQTDNALTGYVHSQRRFKLVSQDVDGVTMPSGSFIPKAGDKYAVFGCMLPDAYISDPDAKTGAEWDMMRKAVAYLYEHEEQRFNFSGTIDGIWAKNDWANIGGKLRLGGNVSFIDERFQKEAVLIRVIAIKDYLNNPHSPEVELSNDTVSAGFTSRINQIKGEGVIGEQRRRDDVRFTKRGFRDAAQTAKALEELMRAGLGNFSEAVSPIAVNAMQLLIGDQSLQLRFVDNKTAPQEVSLSIDFDPDTKKLSIPQAILQHMTLGIDTLSSAHKVSEYRFWDMEQYESAVLDDADKKYWVYAVVQKSGDSGYFELSERARTMDEGGDYYNLLLGLLNTEYEGARSFARLYGFTEVLPGRITTDQIASGNYESGLQGSRLDLTDGTFEFAGGKLRYDANGRLTIDGAMIANMILAENALLAGWVFRNNRLESQNGSVYLDGINGEVRLKGVMQLSTAYQGRLTDANIFYLPALASTEYKNLALTGGTDQIGKVCRFYNASPFGGGNYYIRTSTFYAQHNGPTINTMGVYAKVPPQTCVEFTCFELQPEDGQDYKGTWKVTNRFGPTNFIQDGAEGRFPSMIAMGLINFSGNNSVGISGRDYKGRQLSSIYSISRISQGNYRVTPNDDATLPNDYSVFLSGYGNTFIKGTVEYDLNGFIVHLGRNNTAYDGSIQFMIFSSEWWYDMA